MGASDSKLPEWCEPCQPHREWCGAEREYFPAEGDGSPEDEEVHAQRSPRHPLHPLHAVNGEVQGARGAAHSKSLSEQYGNGSLSPTPSGRPAHGNDVDAARAALHAGSMSSDRSGRRTPRSGSPRTPSPRFNLSAADIAQEEHKEACNQQRREQQEQLVGAMNELCARQSKLKVEIDKCEHWKHVMTRKTRPEKLVILHHSNSWTSNSRRLGDLRKEMHELDFRHNALDEDLKHLAKALSPDAVNHRGSQVLHAGHGGSSRHLKGHHHPLFFGH